MGVGVGVGVAVASINTLVGLWLRYNPTGIAKTVTIKIAIPAIIFIGYFFLSTSAGFFSGGSIFKSGFFTLASCTVLWGLKYVGAFCWATGIL